MTHFGAGHSDPWPITLTPGGSARTGQIAGLCSIMLPAYNSEKWLEQCLESCLAQTYENIEIVAVDDGSTDGTLAIMQKFAERDNRVRIIRHDQNCGEWAARNSALKAARGEYLAQIDSDDWDLPERIGKSLIRLNTRPTCDCVTCGTVWIQDGVVLEGRGGRGGLDPELHFANIADGFPHNSSTVARREVYDYVGGFEFIDPCGADSVWVVRAIMAGMRWAHIAENLHFYRRHSESMMKTYDVPMAVRSIRKIKDAESAKWHSPYFVHRNLDVMTNGQCNLACPACNQIPFVQEYRDYQTSMAEMEKICRRTLEIGATYDWVNFTGGEPLLWDNLEAACKMAKESGAFKQVRLFSNCVHSFRLSKALDDCLIDNVYCSQANVIAENVGPLMAKHPGKITLAGCPNHVWQPMEPLSDSIPAGCLCDRYTIIENTVYPCGAFFSHTKRLGRRLEDYRDFFCSLDDDWIKFFRGVDRHNMDICQYCLNNEKVHPRLAVAKFPHWPEDIPKPQINLPKLPVRPSRRFRIGPGRRVSA